MHRWSLPVAAAQSVFWSPEERFEGRSATPKDEWSQKPDHKSALSVPTRPDRAGMPLAARFWAMHQVDDVSNILKKSTKSNLAEVVCECKNSTNPCSFWEITAVKWYDQRPTRKAPKCRSAIACYDLESEMGPQKCCFELSKRAIKVKQVSIFEGSSGHAHTRMCCFSIGKRTFEWNMEVEGSHRGSEAHFAIKKWLK